MSHITTPFRALVLAALTASAVACSSSSSGHPPVIPKKPLAEAMTFPAATAPVASRMLHASDLGSGWYEAETPAVTIITSLPPGATNGAQTLLTMNHRTAGGWMVDAGVAEYAVQFMTTKAAHHYLVRSWLSALNGVHRVGFVVGGRAYALGFNAYPGVRIPSAYQLFRLAKKRATSGG